MQQPQCLVFGPFRLDRHDERLWCGHEALPLSPRTYAVLNVLVSQAGQLVTKDALIEAVWPATAVSESSLTVAMRQLRRVLGDQAQTPRFIETVHGRGYRFITPVSAVMPPVPALLQERPRASPSPTRSKPPLFVERDSDLAQLAQWWTTVQQGQRQVGMITGEPGIGKTALVEAFVAEVTATEDVWVGHGQCVEHYGTGEAYLPVLEALGRLGRGPHGIVLIPVLRQYAPSWLLHLPALLTPEDRERLAPMASGATSARMLRELAEALEVLSTTRPLVLVLEDLHWSDHATLEWLAYVARRRDPARLLILGTYRSVEVMLHVPALHTIVAELRPHPQYVELALDTLPATAIAAYLQQRCGAQPVPPDLPRLLHQRTGGNPLFLVAMVDELVRQRLLESAGDAGGSQRVLTALREVIPTSLRQYIEQHIAQVLSTAEQALLEAASVAGSTFAVAAVAAGVAQASEMLETRYTALARQGHFIQARGTETWPDGTVTACYQFRHALYHEVVYARVSAGYRVRLHQQIGLRKETGYGAQARQIATELAVHFTRGHDVWRAVQYLHDAGENALRRRAYQEAISQLTTGREMLARMPETPMRHQHELGILMALIQALGVTKGEATPELEPMLERATLLGQQVTEPPQRFAALFRLWAFQNVRSACQTAQTLAEQLLTLAQAQQDPAMLLGARYALGQTLLNMGALVQARLHLEHGIAPAAPKPPARSQATPGGSRPYGVTCRSYLSRILWMLGYPDQAVQSGRTGLSGLDCPIDVRWPCCVAIRVGGTVPMTLARRHRRA